VARTIAKDHDAKRKLILKTAARAFAAQGVDRASMSSVAAACGISKANIYHYYASKNALLFGMLDTYLKDLRDRVCAIQLDHLGPEERFRVTVSAILLAYQGADDEHRVQASGIGALPRDQQDILRGYQRDLVDHMAGVIRANAPQTFAGDPGRLRAVTMSVFGMLNWFYMWNTQAGNKAREDYASLVADLSLKGIRGLNAGH
jgi:AcrR family transcriptional regulator